MIPITHTLAIDENELSFDFVRASGPGGQNVNKVASAVQLRFDLMASPNLPPGVKQRARRLAGSRLTDDGVLVLGARGSRSQVRNREEAVEQLVELLREATKIPKKRRKTKPTRASKERRLQKKKRRGEKKRNRRVDY